MKEKQIEILLIEDNPGDVVFFKEQLKDISGLRFNLLTADRLSTAKEIIVSGNLDIIVTDLGLPDSAGLNTLDELLLTNSQIPIVIFTGLDDRDFGIRAMKAGAQDFLIKDKLNSYLLEKAILYSIERNRLMGELNISENRFRRMFEYSALGIFQSTARGRIIEVNKAFATIFGYDSPDEVYEIIDGDAFKLYKNQLDRHAFLDNFKNAKNDYQQLDVEFCRKDKSTFIGFLHVRRIMDFGEDDYILEGYVQDITLQRVASEKLKANLVYLRNIMESIPSPIFAKDKNLNFTGCNKEYEKYIGYTELEIIGRQIIDFKPGPMAEFSHAMDLELLRNKQRQVFEQKIDYANGEKHDVIFYKNVMKDDNGEVNGIIGVILDISDKKQTLDQLHEELAMNEAMTQLSKELLKPGISLDEISSNVLAYAKSHTQSEHGYAGTIDPENGDLIVRSFSQMVENGCKVEDQRMRFPLVDGKYSKLWGYALNTGEPFYTNNPSEHEASMGAPTGHLSLKNFLSVPVIISGQLVGQIAIANSKHGYDDNDLENVVKLTNLFSLAIQKHLSIEELISSKEKAEQSDKLKSAFLANMSHEIRTPLNAIVGFAQMLGEEGIGDDETHEFKAVIIKNTDILLRLISDIIEMAMIEAGELRLHPETRRIGETLDQINMVWQYHQEVTESEGKIKFIYEKPAGPTDKSFKIDSLRFSQIFDNLLMNAFRFTESGVVKFGYYYDNKNNVVIYVKDTGVGISKEHQKTIFDRFRQVDELRVRPFSGTGLGLAITKKLTELLNGHVLVESELGIGSTFSIIFPVSDSHAAEQPKTMIVGEEIAPTPKGNMQGKRILIVEDNDSSYEFLEVLLKRKGAEISRANNGLLAVEKAQKNTYDIIMMDLQLPEMSGFEAIKEIRLTDKSIPIIVQTAFSEANERESAFAAGCDVYLVKPITKNKLEDAILKFC